MRVLDRFSLKDKVILLTGAAGLYGRVLARDISQAGAALLIASRQVGPLQKVAGELAAEGAVVEVLHLDQSQESSVLKARDYMLEEYGRLDGLVNNAALRPMRSMHDPVEWWDESLSVNGRGLFLMCRTFGSVMCRQGHGSIVNIGSIYGVNGPTLDLYSDPHASVAPDYFFHKGGMRSLTRYFAAFFGPSNVRVNCVNAGGLFNNQDPAFLQKYSAATFLGRMAGDDDLGGAVTFLLGDAASYITGADLPVDGGFTAH